MLPWSTFWERNYFAYAWPALEPLLDSNFVRGGVSGLGVLNLFAGFAELVPVFAARERHDVSFGDAAPLRSDPDPSSRH